MEKTYNGWTNYATWRVNLEVFDGDVFTLRGADELKEYVHDYIYETTSEGLGRDYALAFLSDVNWHEIAKHIKENHEVDDEPSDEDRGVLEQAAWHDTSAELA
jgi:hypothetical protein